MMYIKAKNALHKGDLFLASVLISALDQNDKDLLLFNSCYDGDEEAVKLLLQHGADVGVYENATLFWTAEKGHAAVAKLLKEHIAKHNL